MTVVETVPCCTIALAVVVLGIWWYLYGGDDWWENLFRPRSP